MNSFAKVFFFLFISCATCPHDSRIYIFFSYTFLVAKLAKEEITPLVRKMEKEGKIDDGLVKKLFENGVSTEFQKII